MTPGRRTVRYGRIDEIMPDVERLLAGYTMVGRWPVGQMCRHLALIMRASVDLPASTQFDQSMRVDADTRRAMLERGEIPEAIPTGPAIAHPLLGPLSRAEWDRMHRCHAAHHLSFAAPSVDAR